MISVPYTFPFLLRAWWEQTTRQLKSGYEGSFINPLSPNIHVQILQTGLYTFPLRISWENLIKDQGIFSLVIILLTVITFSLANVWISLGENWCWSLLGLKGLMGFDCNKTVLSVFSCLFCRLVDLDSMLPSLRCSEMGFCELGKSHWNL